MTEARLSVEGVTKRFGARTVLDGVSLAASAGEAVALVGENGAGKSTLLRVCGGLTAPDAGRVAVQGRIGYCPQDAGVLDLLTADEHLILFGGAMGLDRHDALDAGRQVFDQLRFRSGERVEARHLSGGNRQKLNLALALLGDPNVLLLDEPYQGFDMGTYVNFWGFVDRWRAERKVVLVVTHMLAELERVDRVVSLSRHHTHSGQAT